MPLPARLRISVCVFVERVIECARKTRGKLTLFCVVRLFPCYFVAFLQGASLGRPDAGEGEGGKAVPQRDQAVLRGPRRLPPPGQVEARGRRSDVSRALLQPDVRVRIGRAPKAVQVPV